MPIDSDRTLTQVNTVLNCIALNAVIGLFPITYSAPKIRAKSSELETARGADLNPSSSPKLIRATALNIAINGSILAVPDSCLEIIMPLPFITIRALPAHQVIRS